MMVQWLVTSKDLCNLAGYMEDNKIEVPKDMRVYATAVYPLNDNNSYYISWNKEVLKSDENCEKIVKCVNALTGINFKFKRK